MIIVLDKTESIEMAITYLRHDVLHDELFWQTNLDHDDMKYKIDVYVR